MSRTSAAFPRTAVLLGLMLCLGVGLPLWAVADSPWLYGIHFYGEPNNGNVEVMTGGKGIWSLEIVVTNSDPWWHAGYQRDYRFQRMVDRGHTIICRIEPQWGIAVPKEPNYPMATYLSQVQASATALQDVVHIWHVGNEMNLKAEWGGDALSPTDYVDAFKQIRSAIKAVPSSLGEQIVLLGPLSPGAVAGDRHMDSSQYLAEMCAALTTDDFDGFAIHAYGAPWASAADAREEMYANYVAQLCIIDHFGFDDKPVYLTEWNRQVNNGSAENEAQSAQFLHGAFADLHAWNQRSDGHPIIGACWFIYQYDQVVWSDYSLEYLHTINPSGPDNDVFDAFQYACSQNYPAGASGGSFAHISSPGTSPGSNVAPAATISANSGAATAERAIDGIIDSSHVWSSGSTPRVHWLQLDLGSEYALSGFVIHHAEAAGLPAVYNTQVVVLETAPSSDGPWTMREKLYTGGEALTTRTLHTPLWSRYVRLTIPDGGRDPWAFIGEFELYAITPGDCDEDADFDLHDLATFQRCFRGSDLQSLAACLCSHFDADGVVGIADAEAFFSVLTGSGK